VFAPLDAASEGELTALLAAETPAERYSRGLAGHSSFLARAQGDLGPGVAARARARRWDELFSAREARLAAHARLLRSYRQALEEDPARRFDAALGSLEPAPGPSGRLELIELRERLAAELRGVAQLVERRRAAVRFANQRATRPGFVARARPLDRLEQERLLEAQLQAQISAVRRGAAATDVVALALESQALRQQRACVAAVTEAVTQRRGLVIADLLAAIERGEADR
jgi:hypothetical protein